MRAKIALACIGAVPALVLVLGIEHAAGVPPLVTGDVPTAETGRVELYVGASYQKAEGIERQVPFTELVYGVTERQELTFEVPYVSAEGEHGFGDAVLGTKYQFAIETEQTFGVAGSFELKLPNGDAQRGLGTGSEAYDFRLRAQKTFGWFTPILNVGYTLTEGDDLILLAFAQEYRVAEKLKLLSEIYWRGSAAHGEPDRLAGNVGFKYQWTPGVQFHAAVGKSLRQENRGGPDLRVYAGVKIDF